MHCKSPYLATDSTTATDLQCVALQVALSATDLTAAGDLQCVALRVALSGAKLNTNKRRLHCILATRRSSGYICHPPLVAFSNTPFRSPAARLSLPYSFSAILFTSLSARLSGAFSFAAFSDSISQPPHPLSPATSPASFVASGNSVRGLCLVPCPWRPSVCRTEGCLLWQQWRSSVCRTEGRFTLLVLVAFSDPRHSSPSLTSFVSLCRMPVLCHSFVAFSDSDIL